MDNAVVTHECQRLQHLTCEATNQAGCESVEVVRLDQLVEVDAEEFHRDTQVPTEVEMFCHLDDMMLLVRVLAQNESRRSLRVVMWNIPISASCPEF